MIMEVLMPTPHPHLVREDKIHQIYSAMQTGTGQTVCNFNQGLANAYFQKFFPYGRSANFDFS